MIFKKIWVSLCLLALAIPGFSVCAAVDPLESETILFSCDFENLTTSNASFTMKGLSGLSYSSSMATMGFTSTTPWLLYLQDSASSTNHFAGAASAFNPAGTANSWLITTKIDIIDKCSLRWSSQASNMNKRDGLKIYISTTGNNPQTDFAFDPDWEIQEESAGAIADIDSDWSEHEISLQKYKGESVYIAFVNQSTDKEIICLDDIAVFQKTNAVLQTTTTKMSVDDKVAISGKLWARTETIDDFTAYFIDADKTVHSETFWGVNIQPGNSYEFTLKDKLPLSKKGTFCKFSLYVNTGIEDDVVLNDSVGYVSFIPNQKIVIEEGTGLWCGYCPEGILALENIEQLYPNNLIPIAVHNNDALVVSDYDSALGITGFPQGIVNRKYATSPILSYSFSGNGTFLDGFEEELKLVPAVEIVLNKADFYGETIEAKSNVRFPLTPSSKNYKIVYVVTEDNVLTQKGQSNYLYTSSNPIHGKFGKFGEYNQSSVTNYPHQDVARGIFPAFKGMNSDLPSERNIEDTYPLEYTVELGSAKIKDSANASLIVMIIDPTTGAIINADIMKLNDLSSAELTSDKPAFAQFDGSILTSNEDNVSIDIYAVNGQCVKSIVLGFGETFDTNTLSHGCYILRATNGTAIQSWKVIR